MLPAIRFMFSEKIEHLPPRLLTHKLYELSNIIAFLLHESMHSSELLLGQKHSEYAILAFYLY